MPRKPWTEEGQSARSTGMLGGSMLTTPAVSPGREEEAFPASRCFHGNPTWRLEIKQSCRPLLCRSSSTSTPGTLQPSTWQRFSCSSIKVFLSRTRQTTWFWTWFCCSSSSDWRHSGSSMAGRGTCASALWPRVPRSSSCCPAAPSPFTSCCCRPSFCGWSSSWAPCCSSSTPWSCCSDSSPYPPSPGPKFTEEQSSPEAEHDHRSTVNIKVNICLTLIIFYCFVQNVL